MRQHKTLSVMAMLLAVTAAGIGILFFTKPDSEEQMQQEVVVSDVNVSRIQAVVLKNESGTVGLLNTPMGVVVDGAEAEAYAQNKMKALIYSFAHLTAQRMLEEPKGIEEYGLDQPAAQVSLLMQDEVVRLLLGRQNPITGDYYLKNADSDAVYAISEETAGQMTQPLDDLRSLHMFPALTDEVMETVGSIAIESRKGRTMLVQMHPEGSVSSFFGMVEPVVTRLDWESTNQLILHPLRQLSPEHFVSDDVPLAQYGLDYPDYTLELMVDGKIYRCGFTQKGPDTWYCANLESTLVCEIGTEQISFLKTEFIDLLGGSIYQKGIADVSKIGVKYDDGSATLELQPGSAPRTALLNGKQIDAEKTGVLFKTINTIPDAGILQGDEEIEAQSILTITVAMENGKEDILEFHPISERQCAVFVNGIGEFTTYTTIAEEIIDALSEHTD